LPGIYIFYFFKHNNAFQGYTLLQEEVSNIDRSRRCIFVVIKTGGELVNKTNDFRFEYIQHNIIIL